MAVKTPPPWLCEDLLVPGVAPIGTHVRSRKVIRNIYNCRRYVHTEEASDRSIPTVRHALEKVEHALTGVRFSAATKEDGL